MSKRAKIIFTVSFLLNILLAGAVSGMIIDQSRHEPWEEVKESLKPETQNLLARSFQQSSRNMSKTIGEMRQARQKMKEIFSANEFDETAYDKAVDQMVAAQQKLMAERLRVSKEVAKKLPQEEREKIAEKFSRPWGGRSADKPRPYDHPPKPGEATPY